MRFLRLAFLIILLHSCSSSSTVEKKSVSIEYHKVELSYAKGFEVYKSKDGSETKIILYDLEREGQVLDTYYLSKSNIKHEDAKNHFQVPLGDLSIASTTHSAFLISLGLEKNIKGMSWAQYAQDPAITSQIESGFTENISGAEEVDLEKLIATGSKAFTNYPFAMSDLGKFKSVNMPLILVSEYLEETPLARAEWIKFFGAFYGEDEKANEIFSEIEKKYLSLKTKGAFLSSMPMVLIGSEENGVWHMPGGESLIATFIRDAGGHYLFS
ncbi:MAG: iron complex transport system substrate-binding protein, partial [Candidatus Azotimanducaceae bacterium]